VESEWVLSTEKRVLGGDHPDYVAKRRGSMKPAPVKTLKNLEKTIESLTQEVRGGSVSADKIRGLGTIAKAYVKLLELRERQAIWANPKRRFHNR